VVRRKVRRGVLRGALHRISLVLALQAVWLDALALKPELAVTQYSHRAWTAEQQAGSLPQNSVFSIVQTRDGYLWLATQEGLVRFNGASFAVFNSRNTPQIRHNDVWRLLEGRDGSLWIATRGGGLVRHAEGEFVLFSKAQGLADDSVQSIWEDERGDLWIGMRSGALQVLRQGQHAATPAVTGLPAVALFALHGTRDGSLWIGTDGKGLGRIKDGQITSLTAAEGLPHNTVYALLEDRAGSLWIGTGAGLARWRDGRLTVFRTADGLSNDNVRALYEDSDGNLWIGTDGGGLNRYSAGRFSALTAEQGLSNDSIGAILEDAEGNLWLGTDAGGLNRLKDNRFVSFGELEGLSDDNARSVLEDSAGNLWVGTFGGLNRIRDGKVKVFTRADGLSNEVVLSLLEDRAGDLWAGTLGGGINHLRGEQITTYSVADGLGNDTVLALHQDGDGTLWAGTRSGGLSRLEGGRFHTYTIEDGLGSNDVRVIRDAAGGGLWIGTLGGGLNRYRDGKFSVLSVREGLSNDRVLALHEDREGTLWIGTFGGGLNRYRDGRFTAYTTENGLFDDAVFQILEDAEGRLWMSSNRGVFSVPKTQLEAYARGEITAVESTAYGKADGMRSHECNGAHQPAGWRGRDGRLWFATIRGVVAVDPTRLLLNLRPPPVVVERFLANGQGVPLDVAPQLPPGNRRLEFEFAALSYVAPEQVRLKFRLEGFDADWVDAAGARTAHYTNIPPGEYRFQVIASNNDGIWNEEGAQLAFELRPHFYQARWFSLVYMLLAVGIVALALWLHRLRVAGLRSRERSLLQLMSEREQAQRGLEQAHQSLEQRASELARSNAELERFAYVASHDLKEPLRTLSSYAQLLDRKSRNLLDADTRQYVDYISEATREMRARIESLLDYSRIGRGQDAVPETSSGEGLDKAVRNLGAAIAEAGAVITHGPMPVVRVNPAELVQLFQNLLDNAIKFSRGKATRVEVSAVPDANPALWRFSVADNGIGIDPRSADRIFGLFQRLHTQDRYQGQGIGLAICKKIVESHGGRIWVEPNQPDGSRFMFTLPAA
jgi:ligand-binding sensor domain-containing protein/signal transduction histidine kinase